MRISVVVPVFEDREALRCHLPSFGAADEVVVVDASRHDRVQVSDLPDGGRLVRSGIAQRAHQMNLGAREASGEVLLFVHADTRLADGAIAKMREALEDPQVVGGGFERRFDSASRFLRWTCRGATWRSRRFGWFLGDQAIFARRAGFEAVGGYPLLRAFEEVELCRRLKGTGELRCLTPPVLTSARRFRRHGPVRRTLADLGLTLAYLAVGPRLFRTIQNVE